jgi:hypothetical protein
MLYYPGSCFHVRADSYDQAIDSEIDSIIDLSPNEFHLAPDTIKATLVLNEFNKKALNFTGQVGCRYFNTYVHPLINTPTATLVISHKALFTTQTILHMINFRTSQNNRGIELRLVNNSPYYASGMSCQVNTSTQNNSNVIFNYPNGNLSGIVNTYATTYNSAASQHRIWWQGEVRATASNSGLITATGEITVGGFSSGHNVDNYIGHIYEIVAFDYVLGDGELLQLMSDMETRWGTSFVKSFSPSLEYTNNIISLENDSIVNAPIGTPDLYQLLLLRIKDQGTSQLLSWNPIYTGELPTQTTASKILYVSFIYNGTSWDLLSVNEEE